MQDEVKTAQKREVLISIGEASEYLNVSIDTLRRWEKAGRIVAFRSPGGHRYFQKDDLDRLFDKKYSRYNVQKSYAKRESTEITTETPHPIQTLSSPFAQEEGPQEILDRPSKEVKIPETKPISIIKRPEETQHVPKYQIAETITNDSVVQQNDTAHTTHYIEKTPNENAVAPPLQKEQQPAIKDSVQTPATSDIQSILSPTKAPESKKSRRLKLSLPKMDEKKILITITIATFIIFGMIFLAWYSKPKMLSPVP